MNGSEGVTIHMEFDEPSEPLLLECSKCGNRTLVLWGQFEELILDHGEDTCLHSGTTRPDLKVGVRVEPI